MEPTCQRLKRPRICSSWLACRPHSTTSWRHLTLLALADIVEESPWKVAQRRSIRIQDHMIAFVEKRYHKRYAENTRETFRRQVLHQFEQARIVDRNPDDPTLPTNSPRTHYALSEAFLPVVQNYGTKIGQRLLKKFIGEQGTLVEVYQQRRSRNMIAVRDASGREYRLSPGKNIRGLRREPDFCTLVIRRINRCSWTRKSWPAQASRWISIANYLTWFSMCPRRDGCISLKWLLRMGRFHPSDFRSWRKSSSKVRLGELR